MALHDGRVVIAGAAETTTVGVRPDISVLELHAEAARNALEDAGLTIADIDGVATTRPSPVEVAHHLGIQARWFDGTAIGGCSYIAHVRHAAAAVASGAANAVLVVHGESGRSRVGSEVRLKDTSSPAGQFEHPYGAVFPYATFTLPVLRFLHDRGFDREALAEVVVAQRKWAVDNPRAFRRKPITVDDVLGGPEIAYPFTKDMCCVVTDGGGALIVTSEERARDMRTSDRLVHILGAGEAAQASMVSQMGDPGSFGAFKRSSAEAFATSGMRPADIDHLMVYDAFAHLPLYGLEDLGFVGFGESADFIAAGHTAPGGSLPMNTNGGGLSYTHSGMYGMFAMQEAVRQLRGEAAVQAPGIEVSFVQGVGLFFSAAASLVLGNARP